MEGLGRRSRGVGPDRLKASRVYGVLGLIGIRVQRLGLIASGLWARNSLRRARRKGGRGCAGWMQQNLSSVPLSLLFCHGITHMLFQSLCFVGSQSRNRASDFMQ